MRNQKGENNNFYRHCHTDKTKELISKANKGHKYSIGNKSFLGHKHTEEYKQFMSKLQTGRKLSEKTKKKIRESRMKQKIPYKNTKIELKVKDFLQQLHTPFEEHKSVMDITQPDFFIKPNICIYCDGDYWHNRPEVIDRDNRINSILKYAGYKVIRIWEHEINILNLNSFNTILNR
jgi:G:T-mismatch repair DNA endonuclease (very short patch repair protein)